MPSLPATAANVLFPAQGADVFALVFGPPLKIRQANWLQEISERLQALESMRQIKMTDLAQDGTFLDTLMQATQAAIRTQSLDKRACLRAAVLNAASPGAPEAALQQMFIAFVERSTEWHLRLLDLVKGPLEWSRRNNVTIPEMMAGGTSHIIESAFPNLVNRKDFYSQIWKDLYAMGLLNSESIGATMTWNGMVSKRTTAFGDQFLSFITEPAT